MLIDEIGDHANFVSDSSSSSSVSEVMLISYDLDVCFTN